MSLSFFCNARDHPFGQSWEVWTERWCRWIFSFERDASPCLDRTGEFCSDQQHYKKVWFLAGTMGNISPVRRKCTIPPGYSLFFPIIFKEDSFVEDLDLRTEEELVQRANDTIDMVIHVEASIDRVRIESSDIMRIQSHVFDLNFPEHNVYDVAPGKTRSVCDGYWLFVKPLNSGKHVLHFKGSLTEPGLGFNVEVYYDLDVGSE
jgi:hypothetical protein